MKSYKIVASLFLLSSASALAADLPSTKSAPVAMPVPMWTGFYVGLNAGGIWSANNPANITNTPIYTNPNYASESNDISSAAGSGSVATGYGGFVGGGQIGYNWQVMGKFVTGIEADIQGVAASENGGSSTKSFPFPDGSASWLSATSVNTNLSYIGTVRGRIGYLVMPNLLVYGTGGLAYGGVNMNPSVFQVGVPANSLPNSQFTAPGFFTGNSSFSNTLLGWTAGGGIEWMFIQNWSAKIEYNYYNLGSMSQYFVTTRLNTSAGAPGPIYFQQMSQVSSGFNGNIVRAGVNYHFNFANVAPVVAKF
jgi:outer membrane immunogenic protein